MAANEKAVGLDFYIDTWNSNKDEVAKVGLIVAFNDMMNTLYDYKTSRLEDEVGALELDIHNYIKCLKEAFEFDINIEYIDTALKLLSTFNKSIGKYNMYEYRYPDIIIPVRNILHANLEYFVRMLGLKIQTSYDSLAVIPVKTNTVAASDILLESYRNFTKYTNLNKLHDLEDCVIDLAKCTVAEVTRIIGEDIDKLIEEVTKSYMSAIPERYKDTLETFAADTKYLDYDKVFDHLEDALTDWFDSIDKHFTQCNKFGRTIRCFKERLTDVFEVRAEEYDYNLLWDMEIPEYPDEQYLDYIKALKKALDEHVEVTEEIVKDMK
jgi:hypothetical protein